MQTGDHKCLVIFPIYCAYRSKVYESRSESFPDSVQVCSMMSCGEEEFENTARTAVEERMLSLITTRHEYGA